MLIWLLQAQQLRPWNGEPPKHPHLPTQGNFVYFVLPYFLFWPPYGTSRAGSPELCSAAGTQDDLGRGWTAQGAREEC